MQWKTALLIGASGMMLLTGCQATESPDDNDRGASPYGSTGLALSVDFKGQSDVVGMRYQVKTCDGKHVLTQDRALEDLQLPGMIPAFVDAPFDGASSHLFADHFMTLPAGCYNVSVTPITKKGRASEDCAGASAKKVHVHDGLTTEIVLVSQCQGPKRGALDVVAALNHPPVLDKLKYHPSKFLECPAEVVLCATAHDPDDDPLEFEWKQISGPAPTYGPVVTTRTEHDGKVTECIKVAFADESADYKFKVTVYDSFHDSKSGLIRAEKWFKKNGYGDVDSHADLKFPIYVSCDGTGGGPGDDVGVPDDVGEPDVGEPDVGEPDVGEPDVGEPGDACPHTQGYWKNHNRYAENESQRIPWPIDEDTMLCGQTWLEVFHASPATGDAWYILAHQYMAARLNIAAGAPTNALLVDTLDEAEDLLNECEALTPPPTPERNRALELEEILVDYNEGRLIACPVNGNNGI